MKKKDFIYKTLDKIAFIATLATGYGTIAYFTGMWPFTEVPDNEYHITQWFNERKGPVLKGPDTCWFIAPIIKRTKDNKNNIVKIPRRGRQRDIKNLEYLAKDGIQGMLDIQYRWLIPESTDASKFYWEIEGKDGIEDEVDSRIAQIDETLAGALKEVIARRIGKPEALLERTYLEGLVIEQSSSEHNSIYNTFGVKIIDLRVINPRPSEASIAIIQRPFKAEQERLATEQQALATEASISSYLKAAREIKQAGSELEVGDIMRELIKNDNKEDLATKGVTTLVDITSAPQQMIPFPVQPKPQQI